MTTIRLWQQLSTYVTVGNMTPTYLHPWKGCNWPSWGPCAGRSPRRRCQSSQDTVKIKESIIIEIWVEIWQRSDQVYNIHMTDSNDPWTLRQSNSSLLKGSGDNSKGMMPRRASHDYDIQNGSIDLKDLVCYLSLLEGGRPEDKLECKSFAMYVVNRQLSAFFMCNALRSSKQM